MIIESIEPIGPSSYSGARILHPVGGELVHLFVSDGSTSSYGSWPMGDVGYRTLYSLHFKMLRTPSFSHERVVKGLCLPFSFTVLGLKIPVGLVFVAGGTGEGEYRCLGNVRRSNGIYIKGPGK